MKNKKLIDFLIQNNCDSLEDFLCNKINGILFEFLYRPMDKKTVNEIRYAFETIKYTDWYNFFLELNIPVSFSISDNYKFSIKAGNNILIDGRFQ